MTKAIAVHKTPADIIADMVKEKIAATNTGLVMAAHETARCGPGSSRFAAASRGK